MSDHVYKRVELVGSSTISTDDAIRSAIETAAKTLRRIDWFEVIVGEDIPLCNAVQIGCESGMLDRGLLHPREESGPLQFEALLIAALAGHGE